MRAGPRVVDCWPRRLPCTGPPSGPRQAGGLSREPAVQAMSDWPDWDRPQEMIARINTTEKRKTAIPSFAELKRRGAKATMITVYDCPFARLVDQTPAELILVGESLGMVIQGLEHTNPVTLDEVISHVKAVRRGAFDIEPDGSLTRRRIWAQFDDRGFEALDLERTIPDRISLDVEGAIWVASAAGSTKVLRVLEGGVVTD